MIYLLLFLEFFKIGLFSFGGGYATIPFLMHISETYGWYSIEELSQMVAVAAVTPGAVGINAATYAGLKAGGILGALVATFSEILPAIFIVISVSKILKKFSDKFYVKSLLETLKPISCALLTAVTVKLFIQEVNNKPAMALLVLLILLSLKSKQTPIFYISVSAVAGAVYAIILGGGI